MAHAADATPSFTNRLARESSPYLLQHAHNPVDWYPWGPEAFEAARAQDKPIFLSVGYSTCYWCHVMERQSFENEAVAAEMNKRFINIKVDREERPDVDSLYMTFVQVLTRHGGWPMSVFLTPDLKPFYGGTYYPPDDNYGRPGFPKILTAVEDAYRNRRGEVDEATEQYVGWLEKLSAPPAPDDAVAVDAAWVNGLIDRSTSDYDRRHGGFGGAPKFPRETLLELLLVHQRNHPDAARMKMLRHTLDALAMGGIRDQLGGGFHRYSTDARWLVPHFEIMLYDNAMLAWVYVEAYRQTRDENYALVARGVCDFVLREMTSPEGAFYTAFDAEVDAREGLSYLWTRPEVEAVLRDSSSGGSSRRADAGRFCRVYGLDGGPNFADPHHGSGGADKNILFLSSLTSEGSVAPVLADADLAAMRQALYEARSKRKQPLLDTKILTSWNALMIRALAYAGQELGEPRYADAAARAAGFLLSRHRTGDGGLYRASRAERGLNRGDVPPRADAPAPAGAVPQTSEPAPGAKTPGFLDDYAFLVQALVALHDSGAGGRWREAARALLGVLRSKFGDAGAGGFYFTDKDARELIVRQKTAGDSPLPSGNAVAAMCLLDLDEPAEAKRTLSVFAAAAEQGGEGMSSMVQAAALYLEREPSFSVAHGTAGGPGDAPEGRPASPEQLASDVVEVEGEWAGDSELRLYLSIRPGYHVNANAAAQGLIPTHVTVAGSESPAGIEYPPGEERRLALADEPIRVYDGRVTVVVKFPAPMAGKRPPRIGLSYQACNDASCLPAVTKSFEVQPP